MEDEREYQQKKLYRAELVLKPLSVRLETVPEMERYIKKVKKRATIARRYGKWLEREVYVGDGRARRRGGGDGRGIYMPIWSRTDHIVLHELAHTIVWRRYGSHIAGHGWQFCATFYDLVRFMMGAEAGKALKASFKAHRVRMRPKAVRVSRPATPEQLERLAKMREARMAKKLAA